MKHLFLGGLLSFCLIAGLCWRLERGVEAPGPILAPSAHTQLPQRTISKLHEYPERDASGAPEIVQTPNLQTALQRVRGAAQKRAWDPAFLRGLRGCKKADPVRFELVDGEFTSGKIGYVHETNGVVIYVSGELNQPEPGRFFFQKQTTAGVAGDFVGVVEFPASQTAYRIEPTGSGGASEFVQRPLSSVLCVGLPKREPTLGKRLMKQPSSKMGNSIERPIPPYQQGIIVLESLPGAQPVVYLDFAGGSTPSWGGITYARPLVRNDEIEEVWCRVAEDFMPFNINVTTDLQVYLNAHPGARQRVIITPTDKASPGAGGVAYLGSFNWTTETPCWVFMISGKYCAEACSHEVGHSFGLSHDGQILNGVLSVYYYGQGTGETSWAPIMGVGYDRNVCQWSKGEYLYSNNQHDQLQIIATWNNYVTYRPDDTGDTFASSRYLEVYDDHTAQAEGIIERTADTDAFQFTTAGGLVFLRANPAPLGPNLAIEVTLCDTSENILALNNPQDTLWASLTTNLPAGTYTFKVTGAGRHDPLTNGFSCYGCLGYYSITGFIANARMPDRFEIKEHSANGTIVGNVPPIFTNRDSLAFVIASGNTGNTFAIDSSGTLSVVDNRLLDYGDLANQTQLAVQFELFVDVVDPQNSWLSETNRRIVIAVLPIPPTITAQPQDVLATVGSTVSLSISATSSSLPQIQWFFQKTPLPGADGSSLVLTNIQSGNAGQYFATVMNRFASVTSQVAIVTVAPAVAPSITSQPVSQVVKAGQVVSLSVAANGAAPLSYQWLKNGTNLAGASASCLCIQNSSRRDTGRYAAVVSSPEASVQSSNAFIQVISPLQFQDASWTSDGSLQIVCGDSMGVDLQSSELAAFQAQASTNLVGWVPLGVSLWLTNGELVLIDPDSTNNPARFYRIVERLPAEPGYGRQVGAFRE